MKNVSVTRRTLLTGTLALSGIGVLTACQSGTNASELPGSGWGTDSQEATATNPRDRAELSKGGSLNLSYPAIGPNFNITSESGYGISMLTIHAAVNSAAATGGWISDYAGNLTTNPDYVTEFKAETANGTQTISIKINPKATFNDGTPIDIEALRTTWEILRGKDDGGNDYRIHDGGAWKQIASIEEAGDKHTISITMKTPWYPADGSLCIFLHPALKDPELFNNGFDKPLDKYWAGPYKVQEWNTAERYLRVERNPAWWGTQPLLDTITWYEIEDSAEERASFKTGELDVVNVSTVSAYNDITSVADIEIRRGMALYAGVLQLNPRKVPLPIRQAVVAGIDRKQIQHIRFGQLGWKETLPGSLCFLPLQNGYRNNYPSRSSIENAVKILEKAGYTRAGIYTKGEEKAALTITNFTTEPTVASMSNFMMEQLKRMGIDAKVETAQPTNTALRSPLATTMRFSPGTASPQPPWRRLTTCTLPPRKAGVPKKSAAWRRRCWEPRIHTSSWNAPTPSNRSISRMLPPIFRCTTGPTILRCAKNSPTMAPRSSQRPTTTPMCGLTWGGRKNRSMNRGLKRLRRHD